MEDLKNQGCQEEIDFSRSTRNSRFFREGSIVKSVLENAQVTYFGKYDV